MSVCGCLRVLGGLSGAGFAGFFGILRIGEDLLTQVGSDESLRAFTRDHERLRVFTVLGGLSGAGFAGFIGIFRMGEDLLTQVGSDERLRVFTREHERLRVFTCVGRIVWSRICGIYWDFQDGGGPADAGGLGRALDERLRALRESMSVCECLRVLGGLGGAGFAGFIGIFRMGEDLLTQVGSDERWTSVCERLRESMSVCECLRVLGGLGGAGFAGFIEIFRIGEDLLTQVGSDERWTRVCERLREIMSVCECLRVLGGLSEAGFAGFIGIFGMAGVPPALVRSYERLREITSVYVCLDAFTRDWYGWFLWVDHEMGRISCIQTDGGLLCAEHEVFLGWCSMVGLLMRPGEAGFPLNGLLSW